jgi:hypothetical protein
VLRRVEGGGGWDGGGQFNPPLAQIKKSCKNADEGIEGKNVSDLQSHRKKMKKKNLQRIQVTNSEWQKRAGKSDLASFLNPGSRCGFLLKNHY